MPPQAATASDPLDNLILVKLRNVRLSFPNLFSNELYQGEDTGKKTATFLIPKDDTKQVQAIEDAIDRAIAEGNWKGKKPPAKNKIELTFRDGDDESYDGYAGMMSLKASRPERNGHPQVLHADRSPLLPDEAYEKMYPGMYVNANVDFNAGVDGYGNNRVWCNLRGVQRFKDGDRFSSGTPVDVENEFDAFDDTDDLLD